MGASAPTDTAQLLYPGYTTTTAIWAGAGQPSSQAAPCTINAAGGAGAPLTIYLRLYDLKMSVSGAPSSLVATGIGGSGIVYSLIVAPASQTDIPLGQYALGDGSGTVTSGGVPAVVWVTEGGNCLSSAAIAPTPCNSPISVVAS
jgi:hypothetical protein